MATVPEGGKGFAGKTMVFPIPLNFCYQVIIKTGIALEGFIGKGGRVVVKKRIPSWPGYQSFIPYRQQLLSQSLYKL